MELKSCSTCKKEHPLKDFYINKKGKHIFECRYCQRDRTKKYQNSAQGRANYKNWLYKRKYNSSYKEFTALLELQENKCKICEGLFTNLKETHLDHCHNTKKIRGLLCRNCNLGLGHFKDNIKILSKAINYLEEN